MSSEIEERAGLFLMSLQDDDLARINAGHSSLRLTMMLARLAQAEIIRRREKKHD